MDIVFHVPQPSEAQNDVEGKPLPPDGELRTLPAHVLRVLVGKARFGTQGAIRVLRERQSTGKELRRVVR